MPQIKQGDLIGSGWGRGNQGDGGRLDTAPPGCQRSEQAPALCRWGKSSEYKGTGKELGTIRNSKVLELGSKERKSHKGGEVGRSQVTWVWVIMEGAWGHSEVRQPGSLLTVRLR